MIRNQWYPVLSSKDVRKGNMTGTLRLGEKLLFWRDSKTNSVSCIADICCHRGAALSAGKLHNGHPQCPFHGLEFDSEGKCILIPANGVSAPIAERFHVNSYPVREKADMIWIYWSDNKSNLPELPKLRNEKFLEKGFSFAELQDPWKCHYSRCIENQLDVVHLPFVHFDTIGRGNHTVVNGPKIIISDYYEEIYVKNELDCGQQPLKPEEMPEFDANGQHLEFSFPNYWQNYLTKNFSIVIFFVPVDNHNTILYLRFYQNLVRTPILKLIMNGIGIWFSRKIAHQDRRVVHTQVPDRTELDMKENLIQGDRPIVEYRRIETD